ncbi:MAG: AAA family ATPase [Granulosicoccus sp.]
MSNGTIYIFCGKMASGKSSLARQISQQQGVPLISEDTLLGELYPGLVVDVSSYVTHSNMVKRALMPIIVDLLRLGTSLVLDFPANTAKQREWFKDIIDQADARYEFHYLNCSDATCKIQLEDRARKEPDRHATDTVEMFDAITRFFEPPSMEEGFDIINHERN